MSIPLSVATILAQHVTLEVESIDRLYLNLYVPQLQRVPSVLAFFRDHRRQPIVSSALMAPISRAFEAGIDAFVAQQGLPRVRFDKHQRKDEVMAAHLARFVGEEGVLFVGTAQEKALIFRTLSRRNPTTGRRYPWIVRAMGLVTHYYFYAVDRDFGPFFLKFCGYFPYTAKLCLNGHEYLKRQLALAGIAYQPLDNGVLSCPDPARLRALADGLSPARIEAFVRKWLDRLPHPWSALDRQAGYRYEISVLQAELSLTQVLDRPLTGRVFFETVIRENLDLGRPDQVQLIFQRRISRRTPGRFRTRVLTDGVTPSLHIDYKGTRIKQYFKEGRALRTETTINNPKDFKIGKRLHNLPALRQVGLQANRRLLAVQRLSHDCSIGEVAFAQVHRPTRTAGQRVPALRFADPRVHALLHALVLFRLLPDGFTAADLQTHLAPLLGVAPDALRPGGLAYQLRRARLHGLIARLPHRHRYRVTEFGFRVALFDTRLYARVLRPGLAQVMPGAPGPPGPLRRAFDHLEGTISRWCEQAHLAA